MSFEHTIKQDWASGARGINGTKAYTGDGQTSEDVAVAKNASDLHVVIGIDVSEIQSVFMLCDQDLTVCTNDVAGGSPDETISLKANVPYIWTTDSYDSNLLATDITDLYLTEGDVAACTFQLEVLLESTP